MFIIVYRLPDRFTPVVTPDMPKGIKPEEVWLFGTPITRADWNLLHAVDAATALLPAERVHRISQNDEVCNQGGEN